MIRSELLNTRATPTAALLLLASMIMAVVSMLANLTTFAASDLEATATLQQVMHASTVATLTFALIAGLVTSTSDYRFGRMDQLLLSAPSPASVLGAKGAVGAMVGVLYGLAGSVVALVTLSIYYRANDADPSLTSSIVVRPVIGVVVGSALFVALGVGLGTIIRNQPAAIACGLGLLLVLQPPLLIGVPDVGRWLPGAAGLSMTLAPDPALLGQRAGTVMMVGWTTVTLVAGYRRLRTAGA